MSAEDIFLPVFHSFETGNIFTGSSGLFRYRVAPTIVMLTQKEVNYDESTITAQVWHGRYCYEKSRMEDEAVFPLSAEGYDALHAWLTAHRDAGVQP